MKKRFDKSSVTPNLRIFDCDENPLLNRVQGGSRIPLRSLAFHGRGILERGNP
ncbi:MAG: hypothetical protein R3Y28_03130 [Candidatus Gastranaerophilales bacterium]